MNKVKELLAKLKQSVLAAYASLLDFLGISVPEEQPVEQPSGNYHYELTFEPEATINDCCEHEHSSNESVLDYMGSPNAYPDFEGVKEALKPARKLRKKTSKKKLTKKKKPTKKKKK